MSPELIRQARGGDRTAFAELVGPHRGELQVHCYRMLGSLQDAEDAVQETLLSAWLGLEGFAERSSLRTWLYRIATNRCLNLLRAAKRRTITAVPLPVTPPEPTGIDHVVWLQPYPDALLDELPDEMPGPEARYELREAISIAFVAATQLLPPNQRAVLLLRDVLGYRARETADLLGLTLDAVTSALGRARATIGASRTGGPDAPPLGGSVERELVDRFVAAFTSRNVDDLIALMTDDVWLRMPPLPFEYRGTTAVHRFLEATATNRAGIARLVPVRVNRQPAWGEYRRDPITGILHIVAVLVIAVAGDRISEIIRFDTATAPHLGLPRTLRPDDNTGPDDNTVP